MLRVIIVLISLSSLGCSNASRYDLATNEEAVKSKKELTAFELKRAKQELSDWQ